MSEAEEAAEKLAAGPGGGGGGGGGGGPRECARRCHTSRTHQIFDANHR